MNLAGTRTGSTVPRRQKQCAEPLHLSLSPLFFVVKSPQPKTGEAWFSRRVGKGRRYGGSGGRRAPKGGRESGLPPGGAAAQETPRPGPPREGRVGQRGGAVRRSHGGAGRRRELAARGLRAEDGPAEVRARAGCGMAARRVLRGSRPGPGNASAGIRGKRGRRRERLRPALLGVGRAAACHVRRLVSRACGTGLEAGGGLRERRQLSLARRECAAERRIRFWFGFAVYGELGLRGAAFRPASRGRRRATPPGGAAPEGRGGAEG